MLEDEGEVTMAQEPASAAAKSMPINAIQIDHVSHILSPEVLVHKLASMGGVLLIAGRRL
jgi:chemotaxis response regulator CheB